MTNKIKGSHPAAAGALVESPNMPPPAARPSRKQVVLEEDDWTQKLEAIIERDYFPDLHRLENRLEWLEARNSGDLHKMQAAAANIEARMSQRRNSSVIHTPTATPQVGTPGFSEPAATPQTVTASPHPSLTINPSPTAHTTPTNKTSRQASGAQASTSASDAAPKMSLDSFTSRHTSEDNASFDKIVHAANVKRLQKSDWLLRQPGTALAVLAAKDANERPCDGYGTSNQETYTLDSKPYNPKNHLYYDSSQQPSVALTAKEIEEKARGPPKEICSNNTRFIGNPFAASEEAEKSAAPAMYSHVETPSKLFAKAVMGVDQLPGPEGTPKTSRSFLRSPSPAPGVDESPFMTWGRLDGTPLRLEAEETPVDIAGASVGAGFSIAAQPIRDRVNRKLTTNSTAGATLRGAAGLTTTPSPSPLRKQGTPLTKGRGTPSASPRPPAHNSSKVVLSEAARKLLSGARAKIGVSSDSQLRKSYTARTPTRTPGRYTPSVTGQHAGSGRTTPSVKAATPLGGTPSRTPVLGVRSAEPGLSGPGAKRTCTEADRTGKASITDDLLNI
ncbi:hypothetical protein CYMTET_41772 [Cymbomonas tetramitiformis]|uniref:Uncharacterized protein n=1 Tax=Cymbomonas tetramitiformis TaxID=36881 RepID=A0AAE0C5E7_9CHLO|nr:hypothetical protein CYMTET_41772 [Cymbomonas tetramitiformis]|eukprot:gene20539-24614_t